MAEPSNAYNLSGKEDFGMIQEVRASNTYTWHQTVGGGVGGPPWQSCLMPTIYLGSKISEMIQDTEA